MNNFRNDCAKKKDHKINLFNLDTTIKSVDVYGKPI